MNVASRFLALLTCAAFASGCLAPVSDVSDGTMPTLDDATAMVRFAEPILVGKGGDAETSLFVSPDGETILACSHGGFTQPSPLWASTDGGATFERLDPQPNPVVSGDCDVAIGGDGSWYMIYDTIASTTVASSQDKGESWFLNYGAAVPFGGVDRPWISPVGQSTLYMTYANVMVAEPAIDTFTKSTDGGRTWVEQTPMSQTDGERINTVTGHMLVYDDGRTIRVPLDRWDQQSGGPHDIEFAVSRDAGRTWTHEHIAGPHPSPLNLPAAARAGDGTLYVLYPTGENGDATVQFEYSTDDGKSWSDPIVIATGVQFPGLAGMSIDGRPDGTATFAWMETHTENDTTEWVVRAGRVAPSETDPVLFMGPLFEPSAGDPPVYEFLMVRHDAEGQAFILYPFHGDDCEDPPAVDPQDNRNKQCVLLAIERDLAAV